MSPHADSPLGSLDVPDITSALLDGSYQEEPSTAMSGPSLDMHIGMDEDSDDDGAFIAARQRAMNRKNIQPGKGAKKGGGFQSMGLNIQVLKAISRKGFSVPTPIQRKTIPLILDGQDVVGMARTGSGKTAAFVIPMIQKLKAHSAVVGVRSLILSPSRELATQTLKVVKEMSSGTDLKSVLLVGGDSLEEQFAAMAANPDVVIATPGRFLHLQVEMTLDLSTIRYVVFDEADRLFEMGFSMQLTEILHALPTSRQTLLFSATMPKTLLEFARAGLQEPNLVRLDTESKISPDLQSAFLSVKSEEKEASLLHILADIIKMPFAQTGGAPMPSEPRRGHKRKRGGDSESTDKNSAGQSTIVFVATKHHVEYIATLLRQLGYSVSHVYGSLDQTARNLQIENFRSRATNILVVTDVAARGIDIPILANVINYDFPPQPKIFVHRVGRTARAGGQGWSYSLVRDVDVPYMLDLQLFLGRALLVGRESGVSPNYAKDLIAGTLQRKALEPANELVTKLLDDDGDLASLRKVATKAEGLYMRTRNSASAESVKRAKKILDSPAWSQLNPICMADGGAVDEARSDMLARISKFRPQETIFEVGAKGSEGKGLLVGLIRERRAKLQSKRQKIEEHTECATDNEDEFHALGSDQQSLPSDDEETEVIVEDNDYRQASGKGQRPDSKLLKPADVELKASFQDGDHYMSYGPRSLNTAEERGYGVHTGSYNTASQSSNFLAEARGLTMELGNDDGARSFAEPSKAKGMRWDKKNSKYVARANDEDGSKGAKMIRGESGQKIAASFRSGRFDRWRQANKVGRMPRVGEIEKAHSAAPGSSSMARVKRYKHQQQKAPKEADKFRDDYHVRAKRVTEAKEKRIGRFKDGQGRSEIKSTTDIQKQRKVQAMRKAKNARPSRK